MKKKSLFKQLYRVYFLIILVSMIVMTVVASETLKEFHHRQTFENLLSAAQLIENDILGRLESNPSDIDSVCKSLELKSRIRVTVMLPTGQVVGDSDENPANMDNHGDRPEVIDALGGKTGKAIRRSYTLKADLLYAAIPLEKNGRIVGVLRLSMPLNAVDKTLRMIDLQFAVGGAVMVILSALAMYIISKRLQRPLSELIEGAEHFAAGDLKFRLPISDSKEISALIDAMSKMAAQLDEDMQSIVQQHNFLDAILTSMIEGVFAVNNDRKIISINRAASALFYIHPVNENRSVHEAIRSANIHRFVEKTLIADEPIEKEMKIIGEKDILIHARGATLRDANGKKIGAVIVLNDITKLRRLESVRRDFAANVSHELRTPITSIKGFVETLQNGAIKNPQETERFVGIIAKQADRLNCIVEDLLSLSKIEQETEKNEIALEKSPIKSVLEAAAQTIKIEAGGKNISIKIDCDDKIQAKINAPLLEQALVNLLDNAVKYSEPESVVWVNVSVTGQDLIISVVDHGCGIEKEHLPRLFERFYRVDKARSRKLGGTGLGLAIVKHIVAAHGGSVGVESKVGDGSVFTIYIPKI